MSGSEADPIPTGLVRDKYRLTRMLGRGGMGTVYEGEHVELHTRVAVKFIDPTHAESVDIQERFLNEAKAAGRLRSKHVVQVYDHGMTQPGAPFEKPRPFIVMEFLSGEPLDKRLDRVGRLSPADAAKTMLQVCRALTKAHEKGIIHRDLKPENVFIVYDEEDHTEVVKVVDFGIAKITDPHGVTGSSASSTSTGTLLGTPHYMSPEQARGLRSIDRRTDLWSVGVITYRCVVGHLPFKGEAVGDLLVKICTDDPPSPSSLAPDVPPGFDGWIARALAREPGDRFSTASELADALCGVCGLPSKDAMASSSSAGQAVAAISGSGETTTGSGSGALAGPGISHDTGSPLTHTLPGVTSRTPLFVGLGVAALVSAVGGFFGIRALTSGAAEETVTTAPAAEVAVPVPPVEEKEPEVTPVDPTANTAKGVDDEKDEPTSTPEKVKKPARRLAPVARPKPKAVRPAPKRPSPPAAKKPRTPQAPQDLLGY